MVRLVAWVAVWPLASVTLTVKLNVPLALRLMPAGRLPLLTDQVYGAVPPDSVSVVLYTVRVQPAGGAAKLSEGPGMTDRLTDLLSLRPALSVTLTVNEEVPAVVGVPDSS